MAVPVYSVGQVLGAADCNTWFLPLPAYRTSTQSVTSNATLQNDNQLSLPVASNAVYRVELGLLYDGSTTGNIQMAFTAPAGATVVNIFAAGLTTTATSSANDVTAAAISNPAFGALGAGTNCSLRMDWLLTTAGTAGTLQLQWAQASSNGTATRVFAGSFLIGRRVG